MSYFLTTLSITLFALSLYLFRKTTPSKITTALFFVLSLSLIFLFISYGVASYFSGNGIDEATIYHLEYGVQGAGFLEYSGLIITTVALIAISSFCLFKLISVINKNNHNAHFLAPLLSLFILLISITFNPATIDIYDLQKESFELTKPSNPEALTSFQEHYKKPHLKPLSDKHKNIIFVYAESLERTYFDESIFPNLIKGLKKLESKSTFFTNIKQVTGTSWSIAGITASQCGIPLFTPSHGNSMSGMDLFLPTAICLGDLLNDEGYQLNYMGGADLDFAGKGKMFKTHGFDTVLGSLELLPTLDDPDYKSWWGLYDDSIFNLMYKRFIELSELGDKFGLFTLTLDTHHPKGHPSKSCDDISYGDASNPILNSVACSDYLISNFVQKITESPYADNTIIVIASDHLAFKNTASDLLNKNKKNRRNLFMIIDPSNNQSKEVHAKGSSLDIGVTLLPFLGYSGEIGLGRNLLSNDIDGDHDRSFIHSNLKLWRQPITKFWDFPVIQSHLKINLNDELVEIDNRFFKIQIGRAHV